MRQKLREHAGWIFWLVVIALAVVWNSLLVFGPPRLVVRMEWEPISCAGATAVCDLRLVRHAVTTIRRASARRTNLVPALNKAAA
jgi:hypothetical protein